MQAYYVSGERGGFDFCGLLGELFEEVQGYVLALRCAEQVVMDEQQDMAISPSPQLVSV
jgi:hypothetical protein